MSPRFFTDVLRIANPLNSGILLLTVSGIVLFVAALVRLRGDGDGGGGVRLMSDGVFFCGIAAAALKLFEMFTLARAVSGIISANGMGDPRVMIPSSAALLIEIAFYLLLIAGVLILWAVLNVKRKRRAATLI